MEPGLRIAIALDVSERVRAGPAPPRGAGARAGRAHGRRAPQPHQGRFHRRAVARAAHAAERHRRLGPHPHRAAAARPKRSRAWRRSSAASRAQARIISDILDVSRINSGKLRLECEWSDPAELVAASIDSLAAADREKAAGGAAGSAGCGQAGLAGPDPVPADLLEPDDQCHQVLAGRRPDHPVSLRRDGDRLSLRVQDFGQGIRPDFLPSCSTASRRAIRRATGTTAAWAWACPSSSTWWNCMAGP